MVLKESSKIKSRVAILFQKTSSDDLIKRVIMYALENLDAKKSYALIRRVLKEKTFNDLKSGKLKLAEMDLKDLSLDSVEFDRAVRDLAVFEKTIEQHSEFLAANSGFKDSNDRGLFANGWVIIEILYI